jgi:inosine-uridine nucleoside N-ribohydrolase
MQKKIQIKGVVTAIGWPQRRAAYAEYCLQQMGMQDIPVFPGSPIGKTDKDLKDYEEEQFKVAETAGFIAKDGTSEDLFRSLLETASDKTLTFNVIASHSDLAAFLESEGNRRLFAGKVKKVIMMGGANIAIDPNKGNYLVPDKSNNYTFDQDASVAVFSHLQEMKIPMVMVSRKAAAQVPLEPSFYNELVERSNGHPVANLIKDSAKKGIDALWKRSTAAAGSPERKSLPDDRDREWFINTFCGGQDTLQTSDDDIWPSIQHFLPYDYLATVAIVPEYFNRYFTPTIVEVNGVQHMIVDNVKEPEELKNLLKQILFDAFKA